MVVGLGCSILGAGACSSDDSGVTGSDDASAADAAQNDSTAMMGDGAADDGGPLTDANGNTDSADAHADATDAADAGTPWHTTLSQLFNVNDVVTTPSGAMYIIGARSVASVLRGVVVRLLPGGALDTAWGTAGYADVVLSATASNQTEHGVLQANGQLVLLGIVYSTPWDFVMTRLDAAGAVDTTFGASGFTQVHTGIGNDLPAAIAAGPASGFLFTGMAFGASNFVSEIVVGRVGSNGALDPTFDGDGIAVTTLGGAVRGRGVGLDSMGRVLVTAQSDNVQDILMLRFTSAGALDATFSTGQDAGGGALPPGASVLRFVGVTGTSPEGMQKDSTGKFVVYGNGQILAADGGPITRSTMFAVRVDENGAVDSTFHGGGGPFLLTPTGKSYGTSFAYQPSGKGILGGAVYEGPVAPFDDTKYWPAFVVLDTTGARDFSTLGLFHGLSIPHAYPGSDALVAALPNGHFASIFSTATTEEIFEVIP